jgi:hypothetical protein
VTVATAPVPESTQEEFHLAALAIVEIPERGEHLVKVRGGLGGEERDLMIPLKVARSTRKLEEFLEAKLGVPLTAGATRDVSTLVKELAALPRRVGTSRLGWTPEHDAFVYNGTIYYAAKSPARRYEFVVPDGTLVRQAVDALTPRGSRETQYEAFRTLWQRSEVFRLALSLATISPFLEIVGAPPIAFHLAGRSGFGKTTLLRLAISAFADPDSPITRVDFSKDTENYADAQLGMLHNFPLLLDETTLRDAGELAGAAYNIAVGRTKGRLAGPEKNYLPADTHTYTLVCFLSGEASIRDEMDRRGGAARMLEIIADEPLLPADKLPRWYAAAGEHYGWYGRDLVERGIAVHFGEGKGGEPLREEYARRRQAIVGWCDDHARLVDALASVEVGYYLAWKLLGHDFQRLPKPEHRALRGEAAAFTRNVYERLNKTTKIDHVLAAIREVPGIERCVEAGFIPRSTVHEVAEEFDLAQRGKLAEFLRRHDIVTKTEARKIDGLYSERCLILSSEGRRRLSERSSTTQ